MAGVTIERDPPLRRVRLDTGPRNPLALDDVRALCDAIAPDPTAPVVVLHGRADGFCAGLHNAVLAGNELDREELLAAMGELLLAAVRGPTRIVAACAGHAVAAGAMLLLVADARVGARGAYTVGFTEPGLGMPLPELPVVLARERLDRRRLHALTVLGRTVDPEGAVAAGFLDELAEAGDLERIAEERGRQIAALSDTAYRGTATSRWGAAIERIERLVRAQNARRDAARVRRA